MSLSKTYVNNCYFTAGITFKHPYTHRNVGCIAFNKNCPPIIFDCEVNERIG